MKKLEFLNVLLLVIVASCSKAKKEQQQIQVLEYKTNKPLSSVNILLYKCATYNGPGGCSGSQLFATGITDANGIYIFKPGELNQVIHGVTLVAATYWDEGGSTTGTIFMSPRATVSLHLVRQNNYPDTSLFLVNIMGESNHGESKTFRIPSDTVVYLNATGNETNILGWEVITKDLHCYQNCPMEVLATGSVSTNLKKLETTSLSISY